MGAHDHSASVLIRSSEADDSATLQTETEGSFDEKKCDPPKWRRE